MRHIFVVRMSLVDLRQTDPSDQRQGLQTGDLVSDQTDQFKTGDLVSDQTDQFKTRDLGSNLADGSVYWCRFLLFILFVGFVHLLVVHQRHTYSSLLLHQGHT